MRETPSSGFPTKQGTEQPAEPQRQAGILKFCM